ncbi:secretin N-terminal domain-containing protein [Colwellia sp. UCD-KL20]|uniref:secretin N-terminal domain-containing protein n=1 Tax=Colwellia sp. UCD-KL20 TaxID=1917165 RepID=UPI00097110D1|nr:secretin N-terminal domain-containing protein [Colwellia sp. UCD-KL20]
MKTFHIKNLVSTLALLSLVACSNIGRVDNKTLDSTQLRNSEIKVSPSILLSSNISDTEQNNKEVPEERNNSVLKVTNVPDLGGINQVLDNSSSTLELEGEPVTFVADQLSIKEFSHKVFNELLNINYVLAPELASSKTNLTLNISTPISRTEFYTSVNETLTQNKINTYRKGDILYLAKSSGDNKKNNIALGIGVNDDDVPDISGQITHIVPYTYSESRNISSIMHKLATAKVTINSAQKLIILEGEREEIIRALKIINMLDVPRAFGRKIRLFEFAHMTPEDAIDQITSLLQEDGFSINAPGDISFVPMARINSFVAYAASEEVINRISYWANKLDVPLAGDQKQYFVYKPKYAKAEEMKSALSGLLSGSSKTSNQSSGSQIKQIGVDSSNSSSMQFNLDKQQNALIFNTTPIEYKKILSLLEKIDVLPGQVILDVTILEVTLKDDMKSGIDWLYNNATSLPNATKVDFLSSGSIAGFFTSGDWQSNFNWSEEQDDARVISRPYLIVRDGESASITSGDQIPIITQVVEDTGNTGSVSNSVQYRSTGVNVSLTPTINSNGVISLSVAMSVSSSKASANTQVQTPTITNRAITTEIIARNGQTVALGGLIQENKNAIDNGVPVLGSLPILGKLFSSTTDTFTRTELVMLITTKIVRDSLQVDEFSEAMAELYSAPIVIK